MAFALIKTEGLDEVGRERVIREAQAMGRMGVHPHIVSIFDFGEHEGAPYVVTELMGGGDVEGLLEDAEGPLPLAQALDIAKLRPLTSSLPMTRAPQGQGLTAPRSSEPHREQTRCQRHRSGGKELERPFPSREEAVARPALEAAGALD